MKKKIIALLMCVMLTASVFSAFIVPSSAATKTVVDGKKTWIIDVSYNTAKIVGFQYDGALTGTLYIPDKISDYTVMEIGNEVFRGLDQMKSLVFKADQYLKIGDYAFADCTSLNNITFKTKFQKVGVNAFYNTGIYNDESKWSNGTLCLNKCLVGVKKDFSGVFTVNSNVLTIADGVFNGCNKLEKIIFSEGNEIVGINVFNGCYSLKEIVLPKSLHFVYANSFAGCTSLRDIIAYCPASALINVKSKVTQYIGVSLAGFAGFGALKKVVISGDASVATEAFKDCTALTGIICNGNITACGENAFLNTAYYNNSKNWDAIGNVLYIGNCLVKADENISHCYRVKDGTVSIAYNAFAHCTKLKELAIPACVTNIPCLGDVGMCTYEGEHDLCALKIIAPKNSAAMGYAHNNSMLFAYRCLDEHAPRGLVLGGSNKNVEFWYNGCDNCPTNLERVIRAKDGYTLSYDIDGNNELSNDDYNLLKNYIETGEGLTDSQLALADMNHDGVIDAFDLFAFNNYQYNYDFKD
ncbi:MAG: leucine-rich repeat protein [Clostridiaceae bacterium]|nr:leucine-rich repeat protein [Clostridiaceae bacterium]